LHGRIQSHGSAFVPPRRIWHAHIIVCDSANSETAWTTSARFQSPGAAASGRIAVVLVAMAYGLLYICRMRRISRCGLFIMTFASACLLNGCGGRTVNKNLARDVIIGSPADALAPADVQVLSVIQVAAGEAVVETNLHTAFRIHRIGGQWQVREIRVGRGQWEKLDDLMRALRQIKTEETRRSLEEVAAALRAYRQKNGRLPEFKDYVGLSDALYPTYMSPLIREDGWRHPLAAARLDSGDVRLMSAGPDGKMGTTDDVVTTVTFPR